MLIVFSTCGSIEEAEELAKKAVGEKLAGCVQIIPSIRSVYEWEGKIISDQECLLLLKTVEERFPELESFIKREHKYETPEIAAVAVSEVSDGYGTWLEEVLDI